MFRRGMPPSSFYGTVPLPDEWSLVIKAKYGDILKRLNGRVIASQFNYDFAFLLSTLRTVYKFGPQDELVLTYTDEDGDVVILDDDDDLSDAVICQKLNPLRINVQLKSTPQARQQSSNSRSHMPSVLEDQLDLVKSVIDGSFKIALDAIPVVLMVLSRDLRSKDASSLADLLDQIAKLMAPKSGMQSFNGPADGSSIFSSTGPQISGNFNNYNQPELAAHSAPPVATIGHAVPSLGSSTGYEPKGHMPFGSNGMFNDDLHSVFSPPRAPVYPPVPTLDSIRMMNDGINSIFPPLEGTPHCMAPTFESDGMINGDLHSMIPPLIGTPFCPAPTLGSHGNSNSELQSTFPLATISPCSPTIPSSGSNVKINGGLQTDLPPSAYGPFSFFSMPSVVGSYAPKEEYYSVGDAYIDACSMSGSVPQHTLYGPIQCHSCGMTPIIEPLYKSNAKHDYNVCITCLSLFGNEYLYAGTDNSLPLEERVIDCDKDRRLLPDCSFITDITIPAETSMPPSTPFTKIWRIRNSGCIAWPFGTQLTWVSGDLFARQSSVKLEIPEKIHMDQDVIVSVEFVAPAKPGNYVSQWKLALPDLQEFGHGVWVSIQVVQPAQTSDCEQNTAMNFYYDIDNTRTRNLRDLTNAFPSNVNDMYTHGLPTPEDIKAEESNPSQNAMPSAPAGEPIQASMSDPHITSTGAVATPAGSPAPETTPLPESLSEPVPETTALPESLDEPVPILECVPVLPPAPVSEPVPVHAPARVGVPDEVTNHFLEEMLEELEAKGFSQVCLNMEILRHNEYDLVKFVDDLPESLDEPVPETTTLPESLDEPVNDITTLPESLDDPAPETTALPEFLDEPVPEITALPESLDEPEPETTTLPESLDEPTSEITALPESLDEPVPETTSLPESLDEPVPVLECVPVLPPAPVSEPVPVHAPAPARVGVPDEVTNHFLEEMLEELEAMGFSKEWDPLDELQETGSDITERWSEQTTEGDEV